MKEKIFDALKVIVTLVICTIITAPYLMYLDKADANVSLLTKNAFKTVMELPAAKDRCNKWCYKVKEGESVNSISSKFIILPWHFRRANNFELGVVLHPGQIVNIPDIIWDPYEGWASFYGDQGGLFHGKLMANGEIYDQNEMVAAHRHFPFYLRLLVINLLNNKSVIVTVKDRGPFIDIGKRQIDLSVAAAKKLGMYDIGLAPVKIVPLI